MALINFDVQNYCIEPEQLLGAIEQVISEKDVELAITVTSSSELHTTDTSHTRSSSFSYRYEFLVKRFNS